MNLTLETALDLYIYLATGFFVFVNVTYTLLLIRSFREIMYYMRHNAFSNYRSMVQSELASPISILAPAHNEEASVIASVKSLLKLNYGRFEVIVINDGSTDRTLERLEHEFQLYPSKQVCADVLETKPVRGIYKSRNPAFRSLVVVDKENGGKADALNAGINCSRYDYVCCIDADSLLEDDAILRVMKPFFEDERAR